MVPDSSWLTRMPHEPPATGKDLPLVSIVTPSYNKGTFIEETILSVKKQTYPNIEHIVVDGGSTDGTLDILRKYSDSLIWISEPDKGQSDAINKGWKMAKGEILAYLNADDTYRPWAVEVAVTYLLEHPDAGMVYGNCDLIDEHSNITGPYLQPRYDFVELLCGWCMIAQPTAFLRRQVIDEVGYLDTALHMAMDYDLWIKVGFKFEITHIPKVLANFRMCPGTKSVDSGHAFVDDHLAILNKVFSDPELPRKWRRLERRAYSGAHFIHTVHHVSQRQISQALPQAAAAMRLHPQYFLVACWRLVALSVRRSIAKMALNCRRKRG
jgi:glycosyltransferase involved in cell wall biosynthesis